MHEIVKNCSFPIPQKLCATSCAKEEEGDERREIVGCVSLSVGGFSERR